MVKLIRLTTRDSNAIFNNQINEDLIIEENSKIALCNFSAEIDESNISITQMNNKITVQLIQNEPNSEKSIFLKEKLYNKDNYNDLFEDITYKLNEKISYQGGNIGREWLSSINPQTNKVEFQIKKGRQLKPEIPFNSDVVKFYDVVKEPTNNSYRRADPADNTGLNNSFIYWNQPAAKGSSTLRARISRATLSHGSIIGFVETENKPDSNTNLIETAKIKYGVSFSQTSTIDNPRFYSKIINGIETISTTLVNVYASEGTDQTKNDYIDIQIYDGRIKGVIYKFEQEPQYLFDEVYTQENLYPVIIFKGNESARLKDINFTNSPFYTNLVEDEAFFDITVDPLVQPPKLTNYQNIGFLQFDSFELAQYLGFDKLLYNSSKYSSSYSYKAFKDFSVADLSDTYVIELLGNIQLDSYDTIDRQRRNILHTIIQPNIISQRLVYMAPYPLYIDIKNKQRLTLRNIQARVLKEDLTPAVFSGFSQMTILITPI